jgi:Flp pilus assembly protein TadD
MRTVTLAIVVFAGTLTPAVNAQSSGEFWWIARIARAEDVAANKPTFRLYGPQRSIDLKWTFKNEEGPTSIVVVPQTFHSQIQIRVTNDKTTVPVAVVWNSSGLRTVAGAADRPPAANAIELKAGEWYEWSTSVRRQDSALWTVGDYELSMDLASAIPALTTDGSAPWRGRAVTAWTVTFSIVEPTTLTERKTSRRIDAAEALAAGRPQVAVEHYRAAIQLDPADTTAQGGLGLALVAARQFKEAIAPLEAALPSALKEKSSIPDTLAYAYVSIGDEVNAARVLRLALPEHLVQERLDLLRAAARTSPR